MSLEPHSTQFLRLRGIAALTGGVVAWLLTPPFASAYYLAYDVPPPWVYTLRPILSSYLDFAPIATVYEYYGRCFAIVYILAIIGLYGVPQLLRPVPGGLIDISGKVLMLALIITSIGVLGDYWFNGITWPLELLGLLVVLIVTIIYGGAIVLEQRTPRWIGWSLFVSGFAGCFTAALIGHFPSGPSVGLAGGWILIGLFLLVYPRSGMRAA